MSDPKTFADLLEQFNEKYAAFQEDYWNAVQKIVDMLNNASESFGQFLDDILPGENEVENAIKKWNDEILPAIEKAMKDIQRELQEAVNKLAGNPLDLQSWAESYVDAQGMIFKQRNEVEIASDVENAWSGSAFEKYKAVSSVQLAHMEKLGEALEEGGKLTSDAALKILDLWRKLVNEFASYGTDILEIFASATDASKVISFEVPTILEAAAKVYQKVINITDILLEFMNSQATTDSINWKALANTSGGVADNTWPPISEGASDTMNDPGNWQVS